MTNMSSKELEVFDAKLQTSRCVACDSLRITLWKKKIQNNVIFDIYRCLDCSSGFMNPRPNVEWLKSIYAKSGHGLTEPISLEQVLHSEAESPNSTIDAECLVSNAAKHLRPSRVLKALDIGSGYGFFSAAAIKHGFNMSAINPSKWENDVFEVMNSFRPIESLFEETDLYGSSESFHLVILSQVLEHTYDPFEFLSHVKRLLKKNGIVAIAVPNFMSVRVKLLGVRDNSCLWVPEHLNYFTRDGLSRLLRRMDFAVVEHSSVGRIPYFSISNRLNLKGFFRSVTNSVVKYSQVLPLSICNRLGIGFYLNIWAKK